MYMNKVRKNAEERSSAERKWRKNKLLAVAPEEKKEESIWARGKRMNEKKKVEQTQRSLKEFD